ncbi:MAG TPA: ABC transporter substrate-binding protein [Herbaspirillum sp.]|jgi:ABC-type nitrate/sulfonate/bicarbonate transport system substrate-binding protein
MYALFSKFIRFIALPAILLAAANAQADAPHIRVGYGVAAEEQLWLMIAKPSVAPNEGKAYAIDPIKFSGADKRVQAFEAGAIDISTISANAAIFAAAEGVQFKIIGSLSRESTRGFYTKFMAMKNSPIKTPADLKGKTIGLNGFSGSGHLWTRAFLEKSKLAESDVTLVPIPFSSQFEALKAGKIDVGMFPQPFAEIAEKSGNVRTIYTSKDSAPFEEELMLIIAKDDFLKKHTAETKAFLSDLVASTKYYAQNQQEARKALIDGKMVLISPDIYLGMKDYYRDPNVKVDLDALEKMQDQQVKFGFQTKRADLKARVDLSYLPK